MITVRKEITRETKIKNNQRRIVEREDTLGREVTAGLSKR